MSEQIERLLALVAAGDRYDIPYEEIRPAQIAAANARFQQRLGEIGLLRHQAEASGIAAITDLADLVPLLFAHTTYKSYPESWLVQGKWDRLERWLETVSTYPITGVDRAGIADIDDWLRRLEAAGTFVSCSSGTTGKCSMIAAAAPDRAFSRRNAAMAFAWGTGIAPAHDFKLMGTVPVPTSPRNADSRAAIADNFTNGDDFNFPAPPITIGQVSRMVALRRAIADGTATPNELTDYERIAAERQAGIDSGMERTIEALIAHRGEKLLISGQLGLLFQMTGKIRAQGYGAGDYHPENAMFLGGGPKGAVLPPDYLQILMETYNVRYERLFQYYGMQELNTTMPRCAKGRYHVPPWLILLLLDEGGEALVPATNGEAEGRAGFFDLSLDGRWGGVISGDKITVRYGKCDCGHQGPTIGPDIVRYADLGDGDKITCAGTIDAYVRGVA
ncbi:hypothetical protein [Novosphingobium album (ex Liu et al. 2023)]|uniref:Acyl-protein synthetase LuxE domain-containing protein n=1 Tax=Novosphingobium album (ex Liu et al. 2023) TaxID=3031130 RepID=A0ABT5WMC1_9SPHN|nr:hypothetical protein [Novosphingobium album (ex Liu et al. 2023)]MDE8651199.1 hypothetical protein [Novosphingobium album (ex Liu et al. 2023)]